MKLAQAEELIEDDPNEDSMLLDGFSSNRCSPRNGLFDRLKQAEKLLSANLDALSS